MQFKTLALAAAVSAAAFAASANAADIKFYGAVDTGLTYTHGYDSDVNTFEMTSGNYAGPRWGVKGSEELATGVKVNFILEAGFASDTGALGKNGSLFNRESQINISSDYGTIGFGRVGAFTSGSSSLSWYWDMEPFETGYIDAGVQASQINVWRLNSNTIYYVSPTFAGVKFGAQYSLTGENDKEAEKFSDNNSFANIAVRYDGEALRAVAGLEYERFGQKTTGFRDRQDDAYNFKLAGAYAPGNGPLTIYAGMSWFKNYSAYSNAVWVDSPAFDADGTKRLDAWSGFIGAKYTIGQADLLASVQYLDGRNKDAFANAEDDYSRIVGAVGCHYHLSGRTMLYAIGSYSDGSGMLAEANSNRFMAHLGMTHFF